MMISKLISDIVKEHGFSSFNELKDYLKPYVVDGYVEIKYSFASREWVDRYDMQSISHLFEVCVMTKNMKSQ